MIKESCLVLRARSVPSKRLPTGGPIRATGSLSAASVSGRARVVSLSLSLRVREFRWEYVSRAEHRDESQVAASMCKLNQRENGGPLALLRPHRQLEFEVPHKPKLASCIEHRYRAQCMNPGLGRFPQADHGHGTSVAH